jgi:hypothetical protein
LCLADAAGETLAAPLWPGNAGAKPRPITSAFWTRISVELIDGIAATGGDPSAIGSVIFPLREYLGDAAPGVTAPDAGLRPAHTTTAPGGDLAPDWHTG